MTNAITNGTFDTDLSGWSVITTSGPGWAWDSGVAKVSSSAGVFNTTSLSQTFTLGSTTISFDTTANNVQSGQFQFVGSLGSTSMSPWGPPGHYDVDVSTRGEIGKSATITFQLTNSRDVFDPFFVTVDNVENLSTSTIISCPVGWTFLAQDTTSRTLDDWETFSTPSLIQTHYEATGQVYEDHRTNFDFGKTEVVNQKEGVGLYFNTPTDITLTLPGTPSITLEIGWNLVANFGSSDRTLGTLKTSIGGKAVSASYFNKSTQTFQTDDATIVPAMEAFFVNMSGSVAWSG